MRRFLADFCQEAVFADILMYDHRIKNYPKGRPLKFQDAPFDAIKNSGNKIFIGILTGNEPEITTGDHISDCLGVWGIHPSFRFHNSLYQF